MTETSSKVWWDNLIQTLSTLQLINMRREGKLMTQTRNSTTKDFAVVKSYACKRCGKVYKNLPDACSCRDRLHMGMTVGPFLLLSDDYTDGWRVNCRLCDMIGSQHRSNIKRAKSCGCKPSHIDILSHSLDFVKYVCNRCEDATTSHYPVIQWCCNDE